MSTKAKPKPDPAQPLKNPRHEAFAGRRALGYSQRDAYLHAFPSAKSASDKSIDASAARLAARPDVRERIAQIQADLLVSSDAYITKRQLLELLSDKIRHAFLDGELQDAVAAAPLVREYNRMCGNYEPERVEASLGVLSPDDRDRKIAALLAAQS